MDLNIKQKALIAFFLVIAVFYVHKWVSYSTSTGKTDATITELHYCSSAMLFSPPYCKWYIKFTVEGKEYSGEIRTSPEFDRENKVRPGSTIPLYYKKSNPEEYSIESELPAVELVGFVILLYASAIYSG